MKLPHLTNGQKTTAVAIMGVISLLGLIALAIVDLLKGSGEHPSLLMSSAFTFLTVQAGSSATYLMGTSMPDQAVPAPQTPVPITVDVLKQ